MADADLLENLSTVRLRIFINIVTLRIEILIQTQPETRCSNTVTFRKF